MEVRMATHNTTRRARFLGLSRVLARIIAPTLVTVAPVSAQPVSWNALEPEPAPRYAQAMVYDQARHNAVLFGGAVGSNFNGETWDWSGSPWARPTLTGPSPPPNPPQRR